MADEDGRQGEMAAASEGGEATAMTEAEEVAWLASMGFLISSGEEDGREGTRWFLCGVDDGVPIGPGFPSRDDAIAAARIADEWHEGEMRLQEELRREFGIHPDDG